MRRFLASTLLFWPSLAGAQELADIFAGFDDNEAVLSVTPDEEPTPDQLNWFQGILSQRIITSTGGQSAPHDGLTSLRTQVNAAVDFDIAPGWRAHADGHVFYDGAFGLNGRAQYTTEYLRSYESEVELGEAFIQGQLGEYLDLKFGRQIVVWGKSDAIRVTDILNPLDMREPGLTDIRDLRLPITMAKLDYYFGNWNLSAIVIPEVRFNKTPVLGSDFFPGTVAPPQDDQPGEGFGNFEYAAALNGTFTGWDMSVYGASVFNDMPHIESTIGGPRRRHARIEMVGASANVGLGNWLIKGEVAALDGLKFMSAPGETFRRVDALVGFDYNGFSWGTVTFEAANRRILDFDPAIAGGPEDARENEIELAFRVGTNLMNDKLSLNGMVSALGLHGENGGFRRIDASYDLSDSSKLIFGFVDYVGGDKAFFKNIGNRDRAFLKFERRF
jgi:hypothetical protein